MATDKVQTGFRFEYPMLVKIAYVAKKNKRSMNAQVEYLVQQCIEEYEAAHGEIPLYEEE